MYPETYLADQYLKLHSGVAATIFQTPWVAKLLEQITQELQSNFNWIDEARTTGNKETKLLDYACGNGMVSRVRTNL